MRNVIFAINITLDGCADHTKQIADKKHMNILRISCEMLTCSSSGVKPTN
jgi:hypothetical protein